MVLIDNRVNVLSVFDSLFVLSPLEVALAARLTATMLSATAISSREGSKMILPFTEITRRVIGGFSDIEDDEIDAFVVEVPVAVLGPERGMEE